MKMSFKKNERKKHFKPTRMAIMRKAGNKSCWGCGHTGALLCCRWGCKMVQPWQKTFW